MSKKIATIARMGISCLRNANNPYFNSKYADLATVVDALREPLGGEGLGYYFSILNENETWQVCLTVVDVETGKVEASSVFPVTCLEPQKMGSNVTYAKRYLLTTMFNVIAELDDDGNATLSDKDKKAIAKTPQAIKTAQDFFN